jgi:iron complex outermembrane recepter protein
MMKSRCYPGVRFTRGAIPRAIFAGVGLWSAVCACAVYAQEEPAVALPVVDVTADTRHDVQSRTELGRLTPETPAAGSTVEREELEQVMFVDSVNELLNRIPGTSLTRNLRIPIGGRSYTANLIDGQAVKSPHQLGTWGFIEEVNTWDIERIEVTRGPGSVLNASNAVGGTINVITRQPPPVPEYRIWGQAGEYGLARGGASAAGTTTRGLGYLLDANALDDRGWRESSARQREAVSAKLAAQPTDATSLQFRVEHLDVYQEDPGNLSREQFEEDWSQAALTHDVLYEDMRHLTPSFAFSHFLSDRQELRINGARRESRGTEVTQGWGQAADAPLRETEKDYVENNVQIIYRYDFAWADSKVYVGADLIRGTKDDDLYARVDRTRGDLMTATSIDEEANSPFVHYEFSATPRLRFALGARHEEFTFDVDQVGFDFMGNPVRTSGSRSYSKLVKKGGLTYALAENHMLWANLAEGFLAPSTAATVTATYPNPDVPAETMLTAELGLRGRFPASGLAYDLALYETTIDDFGLTVYCLDRPEACEGFDPTARGAAFATFTDAVGRVRFRGLEAELSWQVREALRFDMAYTHAINTLVDYEDRGVDYSGNLLSASPRNRLNLRATVTPTPRWYAELEGDYVSSYYTGIDNTDRYKRPDLYHLRAGYRTGPWHASLALLNLTDARYSPRVSLSGGERIYNAGYAPRTLRAGLSYTW